MENNTNNSSAQPQVQSTVSAPVSNKQGGTKKSSSILTIVFLITTLGFAGAFAWAMFGNNGGTSADKADTKCVVTQEQVDKAEEGTVGEIVADFDSDSYIRGLIRKANEKLSSYTHPMYTSKSYDDGVYYFADNYISKTSKSYGIIISGWRDDLGRAAGSGPSDFAKNDILDLLANEGFTKDENAILARTITATATRGFYRKDSFMCDFYADTDHLSLDCASEKWFTDADKAVAEGVDKAKGYDKDEYIVANRNYVKETADGKYEIIELNVYPIGGQGGHVDLFYRAIEGGEWTYVTGTQGTPSCSDFEGAASEAFAGYNCADAEGNLKKVGE